MTATDTYKNLHADSRLEIACVKYLGKLGYSLWSSWEIVRDDRRKLAANWFSSQMTQLMDDMNTRDLARVLTASRIRRLKARFYGVVARFHTWRMGKWPTTTTTRT